MITYGIIGAMPSELSEIAAAFPDALKETSAMYEFHVAEKNGKKIVFCMLRNRKGELGGLHSGAYRPLQSRFYYQHGSSRRNGQGG